MASRIAILHASFDILGGAEYVAVVLANQLKHRGFDVVIHTATDIDREKIRRLFGLSLNGIRVIVSNSSLRNKLRHKLGGRFVRLRKLILYKRFFKEFYESLGDKYDVTIDTQSNFAIYTDISYIHYPALLYFQFPLNGSKKIMKPYDWLVKHYYKKYFLKPLSSYILTNSTWTAKKVYEVYRVIPHVVYPPVALNGLETVYSKENIVVTVSRFTPEKNMELIPLIARTLPEYDFFIVGSTSPFSEPVIDRIYEVVRKNDVDNVFIYTDLPRESLVELLSRAKYYLHPPFPEHFGISIVEAMRMKCIPIVYRDGGAWHDIVSHIDTRLGYSSVNEVREIVKWAEKHHMTLSWRAYEISKLFTPRRFEQEIMKHIEYVLRVKSL